MKGHFHLVRRGPSSPRCSLLFPAVYRCRGTSLVHRRVGVQPHPAPRLDGCLGGPERSRVRDDWTDGRARGHTKSQCHRCDGSFARSVRRRPRERSTAANEQRGCCGLTIGLTTGSLFHRDVRSGRVSTQPAVRRGRRGPASDAGRWPGRSCRAGTARGAAGIGEHDAAHPVTPGLLRARVCEAFRYSPAVGIQRHVDGPALGAGDRRRRRTPIRSGLARQRARGVDLGETWTAHANEVRNRLSYASAQGGRRKPRARTSSNHDAKGDLRENVPPPMTRPRRPSDASARSATASFPRRVAYNDREWSPDSTARSAPLVGLNREPMVELGARPLDLLVRPKRVSLRFELQLGGADGLIKHAENHGGEHARDQRPGGAL